MRLDRLLKTRLDIGRREVRGRLAEGGIRVNGAVERDGSRRLDPFDRVESEDQIVQARTPRYVLLHKPAGYASATVDDQHPTVIDLVEEPWAHELHLAGRLDRATTGLVILTNDSRFSEALTLPGRRVPKVYLVEAERAISAKAIAAFRKGMRFEKENITTHPAKYESLGERCGRLTIFEGKHHQVKRMFGQFDIAVTRLHREAVGSFAIDDELPPGAYRVLHRKEIEMPSRSRVTASIPDSGTR